MRKTGNEANSEGAEKKLARFDSGKWLQILPNFQEVRTRSEQIIVLPPFSVHTRTRGNCEIRFRLDGKQKAISAGTKNLRTAESQAEVILARWLADHRITLAVGKSGLESDAAAFIQEQYANCKPATRAEAELIIRRLLTTFPEVRTTQDMTPEVFRAGADELRGKASPKYWANILITCRRLFRWLEDRGRIARDPTKGIPVPPRHLFGRREEIWTEEELESLLPFLNVFDQDVLMVMRWAGMDSSDVFELRKRHIKQDDSGAWMLRKRREKAKSDEETILQPISSKILPMLLSRYRKAQSPDAQLFGGVYSHAHSFTASLLGRVRRTMSARALPPKDLKSLRHTFASYHAERGVPIDVLRQWMGHSPDSRVLDRVYIHRRSTARFMD